MNGGQNPCQELKPALLSMGPVTVAFTVARSRAIILRSEAFVLFADLEVHNIFVVNSPSDSRCTRTIHCGIRADPLKTEYI